MGITKFNHSHNILFNGDLVAKVSDFGMALHLAHVGSTHVMTTPTALLGSRGYTAPEYVDGKVGTYLDVYSYGVVSVHELCSALISFCHYISPQIIIIIYYC